MKRQVTELETFSSSLRRVVVTVCEYLSSFCARDQAAVKKKILRNVAIKQLQDEFDIVKIFRTLRQVKLLRNIMLNKDQITLFQTFKDKFIDTSLYDEYRRKYSRISP